MLINCTNKGCLKASEAKVNKTTGEIICMECGKPISNITEFTKKTLVMLGQIVRAEQKKPFHIYCTTCLEQREIKLVDEVAHCSTCDTELRMSGTFLNAFKQYLAQQKKEED